MKKQEYIAQLNKAIEFLAKNTKPIHVLSDDENKRSMAMLNRTLRQIRMFIEMQEMKEVAHPENKALINPVFGKMGALVQIRPCADEYKGKTFLGFLIGEIALGSSITIHEHKIQLDFSSHNPAIFVPSLKKIIYGCESWWGEIESEDQLRQITDKDIENVWYVKLYQQMNEPTFMNKQQAIQALQQGKKLTHEYFQDGEYIYMENGNIFSEDGVHHRQFWELRDTEVWDKYWVEVK